MGIKRDMRIIGFFPFNHPNSELINYVQYFVCLALFFIRISSSSWFFLFRAKNVVETIEVSMPLCCGFFNMLGYCSCIWQRQEMNDLIKEFETMIAKRKSYF